VIQTTEVKIQPNDNIVHVPVLLEQVLTCLEPREGEKYLDLTGGYGGHAAAVLERTQNFAGSMLVDRDDAAVTHLTERFNGTGLSIRQADFLSASEELKREGKTFDMILPTWAYPHRTLTRRVVAFPSNKMGRSICAWIVRKR